MVQNIGIPERGIPQEGIAAKESPQYWHWSRAVPQPEFKGATAAGPPPSVPSLEAPVDISKGQVLEGTGQAIEGAAKGADEIIKTFAGEEARDVARKARDTYTGDLEQGYANVSGQAPPQSLVDRKPGDNAPDTLKQSISGLKDLKGARANNKLSETAFWGLVDDRLSSIRAKYGPGYYKYIDEQASSVLGTNPANAYVRGLISDINTYVTAANDQMKATRTKILNAATEGVSYGGTRASEILRCVDAGSCSHEFAIDWLNRAQSKHWQEQEGKRDLEIYKNNKELQGTKAGELLDKMVGSDAQIFLSQRNKLSGLDENSAANIQIDPKGGDAYVEHIRDLMGGHARRVDQIADTH